MTPHTKLHPGGLLELASISFPLMLMSFSSNLMIFCNRIILANYSVDAMTAAFSSNAVFSMFILFGISVASIAEVFIGQYNGKQEFDRLLQREKALVTALSLRHLIVQIKLAL